MNNVAVMLVSMLLPLAGLGLLLWLTHLEETLPRAVRAARRKPEPPPILAIPVRAQPRQTVVTLPTQRAPEPEASPVEAAATG